MIFCTIGLLHEVLVLKYVYWTRQVELQQSLPG